MKKITLSDISQSDFDAAAATVSAGIKAFNRKLDTRGGTVLRDLLVDPEAAIESVISGQISEVVKTSSLKMLKDAQDSGEEIDMEDVSSIMSNFNIKSFSGSMSKGLIKIVVSDGTVAYSISKGAEFSTVDNVSFVSEMQVTAVADDKSYDNPSLQPNATLYKGAAGWFFLVPAVAASAGISGNIKNGTALTPETRPPSFVSAESYGDFSGGSDVPSVGDTIEMIPSALSIRGFVNKNAVEGMLRDEFDGGDNPIVAVSAVGYGNPSQIRDRHNVFGVGVGGRVDVYVRNFTDAYTETRTIEGTRVELDDGSVGYRIEVPAGSIPCACWIKSVSDPFNDNYTEEDSLSSLVFYAERTSNLNGTWHDIDRDDASVEAFNTVWQGFTIHLKEVPPDIPANESSTGRDDWSQSRKFKVTVYCMPQGDRLQEFADRDDIRSVSTDVVVRCPIVCSVSVNAIVNYDPMNPMDQNTAAAKIRSYINNLGFVGRLTRSEIVQILKNLGAVSVDMRSQDMLYGSLHDALGIKHELSGDALDISSIENGRAMLSKDTVVFCAEAQNIQIKMVPNL